MRTIAFSALAAAAALSLSVLNTAAGPLPDRGATAHAALSSGPRTIAVRPGELNRGDDPQIPWVVGRLLVDGDVRVRVGENASLLGRAGPDYLVRVYDDVADTLRVLRISRDGTRSTVFAGSGANDFIGSADGATFVRYRSTGVGRSLQTTLSVHEAATGEAIASRRFKGVLDVLDAHRSRVLLGRQNPRTQTMWWNYATGAVSTLVNQDGYFADIRADRFATLTGDPYRDGCSTLRALSNPRRVLSRSCEERVEAVSPNGRRFAAVHLLADGLGPTKIMVRGGSGRLFARYRVDGWIGRVGFENNRALLFDAVGSHRQAVARCTASTCERASGTRRRPQY